MTTSAPCAASAAAAALPMPEVAPVTRHTLPAMAVDSSVGFISCDLSPLVSDILSTKRNGSAPLQGKGPFPPKSPAGAGRYDNTVSTRFSQAWDGRLALSRNKKHESKYGPATRRALDPDSPALRFCRVGFGFCGNGQPRGRCDRERDHGRHSLLWPHFASKLARPGTRRGCSLCTSQIYPDWTSSARRICQSRYSPRAIDSKP